MSNKERLIAWMKEQNITAAQLGRATGDPRSAIFYMTNGHREINQAFMWRFANAFGFDVARQIFLDNSPETFSEQPASVAAPTP